MMDSHRVSQAERQIVERRHARSLALSLCGKTCHRPGGTPADGPLGRNALTKTFADNMLETATDGSSPKNLIVMVRPLTTISYCAIFTGPI